MEEATELFGIMQSMLRESQQARKRLEQAKPVSAAATPSAPAMPSTARGPVSDDTMLLGLLALGATAGLGAAFAKRLSAPAAASAPPSSGAASDPSGRRARSS